jgi:hypothetical protein
LIVSLSTHTRKMDTYVTNVLYKNMFYVLRFILNTMHFIRTH